jgi:hypothetical protein
MKHALPAALALMLLLAGCANDPEHGAPEATYVPATASDPQAVRQTALAGSQPVATGSLPASDARAAIERAMRNERLIYAQGLERILRTNGVSASVAVDEDGQGGPTPALRFFGHFSPAFIHRALTSGAVLERARSLGFRTVDFFDRGPDGNFVFELSKTGPLPRCEAHNRLCL